MMQLRIFCVKNIFKMFFLALMHLLSLSVRSAFRFCFVFWCWHVYPLLFKFRVVLFIAFLLEKNLCSF